MVLRLEKQQPHPPVSLTARIRGYKISSPLRHFSREVWQYHLFGWPGFPLGTREGIPVSELLDTLLQAEAKAGEGIIHFKIRHEHTPWTWISAAVTLGIVVPTALILEGDVVQLMSTEDHE